MEMLGGFACLFVGFCFEMALVMDRCLFGSLYVSEYYFGINRFLIKIFCIKICIFFICT